MSWKNGTLATRSQIRRKSRCRVSLANPVARMPAHKVKDENAADHDRTGQDAPGRSLRNDAAIAGGRLGHDRPPERHREAPRHSRECRRSKRPRRAASAIYRAARHQELPVPRSVEARIRQRRTRKRSGTRHRARRPRPAPFCDCIGQHDPDAGRDHRMANTPKHPRGSAGGVPGATG